MATIQWTDQQQTAIEAQTGSLLVSAAAGSGKTAVLVERVVNLMTRQQDPIAADRFLIVTFTNAAADELRASVSKRLEKEIQKRPNETALKKQRVLLQRTFIGTINAYCLQLVQQHFAQLDLPADIKIGDVSTLEQLAENAMAQTLEIMYQDPHFVEFVALYGRARSDFHAQQAIKELVSHIETLPNPRQTLDDYLAMYSGNDTIEQTVWGEELLGYAADALESVLLANADAQAIVDEHEPLAGYRTALDNDRQTAEAMLQQVRAKNWDGAYDAAQTYSAERLSGRRDCDEALKKQAQALRNHGKELLERLRSRCFICTNEKFVASRKQQLPLVKALVQATHLYLERFDAIKREEKLLSFTDTEHLALSLLQDENGNQSGFGKKIAAQYHMVLVDEYQDTNELNDAIYNGLSTGDNLFLVGDVKQSIYRFRKANPGLFLQKRKAWQPHSGDNVPSVVTLGHNFRSGQGVINGVNHVFSAIMSDALGDIEYTADEALIQGIPGGAAQGFEVDVVTGDKERQEYGAVAQRIQQLVEEGYEVRDGGAMRRCSYGDFAILLRTRGNMDKYAEAMDAYHIPYVSDADESFLQTPEILALTAVLMTIDNPGDEVSLTAALMGPFFRFTIDEVSLLRAGADGKSLWGALLQSDNEKVADFIAAIKRYRHLAASSTAAQLCEEVLFESGYLSAVSAMENAAIRRDNLLHFVRWAEELGGSLAHFIRLLRQGVAPQQSGFQAREGHVSLLTVHKSKGLEFPICIVADLAKEFNRDENRQRFLVHAELGFGMYERHGAALYATLPLLAIRSRIRREGQSEEMRIFYVALTRAKDLLITVSFFERAGEEIEKQRQRASGSEDLFVLRNQTRFTDWLFAALFGTDAVAPLIAYAEGSEVTLTDPAARDASPFVARVVEAPPTPPQPAVSDGLTASPDDETVAQLLERFDTVPPHQELANVPAKVSVSALVQSHGEPLLSRPSFMYKDQLTAAERGTAQHTFMQYANFEKMGTHLEEEIAYLQHHGYLTDKQAESLDRNSLKTFAESPLAKRIATADKVYREFDFITGIAASKVEPGLSPRYADETVMMQGIADLVLVNGTTAEIVDYKTDGGKTERQFIEMYSEQLTLYRKAVQRKLNLPVEKLTIWAFALNKDIDVPL